MEVRFGQPWCGFEVPAELASRPIDRADPETRRIATMYLESVYVPSTAPLSERVSELARRLLPTGHCTVDEIADQLAMHPRTLQRRLGEEDVGCQDLIDRAQQTGGQAPRRSAAAAQPGRQPAGLRRAEHVNRSCRRWFGKTPRQYRADLSTAG